MSRYINFADTEYDESNRVCLLYDATVLNIRITAETIRTCLSWAAKALSRGVIRQGLVDCVRYVELEKDSGNCRKVEAYTFMSCLGSFHNDMQTSSERSAKETG